MISGEGVEKDEIKAFQWYKKAADQGNAKAQYSLGWCYQFSSVVEKDEKEAVKLYKMAAEQGLAEAQYSLGWCFQSGVGVNKDVTEAIKWYKKGAINGSEKASKNLNKFSEWVVLTDEDNKETIRWYLKAAEDDVAWAQYDLGWCYLTGTGLAQDRNKAIELFKKAKEKWFVPAHDQLVKLGVY